MDNIAGGSISRRKAAIKATSSFTEQLASSSPSRPSLTAGPSGMSSESELSSLEDEDSDNNDDRPEAQSDGKLARDNGKRNEPSTPVRHSGKGSPGGHDLFRPSDTELGMTGIKQPTVVRTYGKRHRSSLSSPTQVRLAKSSASPSHTTGIMCSPLTALSTPNSRGRRRTSFTPVSSPVSKRKREVSGDAGHDYSPSNGSPSKRRMVTQKASDAHSTTPKKTNARNTQNSSFSGTPRTKSILPEFSKWALTSLGELVWTRVGKDNRLVLDSEAEAYWWPAKVETMKPQLQVKLFYPPSLSKPATLVIQEPSESNVLSLNNAHMQLRFNIDTFHNSPCPVTPTPSSRKYAVNNIKSRWTLALDEMTQEDELMNDGLPSSISAIISQVKNASNSQRSDKNKVIAVESRSFVNIGRRRSDATVSRAKEQEREVWSPPPPDPQIEIPGELVLAKEKKKKLDYWPAQVLGYISPEIPEQAAKYHIKFLDNVELAVTRDMFYIFEQDEFATCKMGRIESDIVLNETDGDDDLDISQIQQNVAQFDVPEPLIPAPPPKDFCILPMDKQAAYVVPILKLIFGNSYKPSEPRNYSFSRGGKQRSELSKDVKIGNLSYSDLRALQKFVINWGFRQATDEFAQANNDIAVSSSTPKEQSLGFNDALPAIRSVEFDRHIDVRLCSEEREIQSKKESGFSETECTYSSQISSGSLPDSSQPEAPPSSIPPPYLSSELNDSPRSKFNVDEKATLPPAETVVSCSSRHPRNEITADTDTTVTTTLNVKTELRPMFYGLSDSEKINYCTDVLLPEAIIQLLLWRSGERTNLYPVSDEEEDRLYEIGRSKTEYIDFVLSILQLREKKIKALKARSGGHYNAPASAGGTRGTRTRPRNI